MNEYDVKRLALVLAVQAEIEGGKAENMYFSALGHDIVAIIPLKIFKKLIKL